MKIIDRLKLASQIRKELKERTKNIPLATRENADKALKELIEKGHTYLPEFIKYMNEK